MGVLNALGEFNEDVENATDAVLDQEGASIQNNVRRAHMALAGYDSEEEYAEDVSQQYDNTTDAVTDRAGELTDNEVLGGAGRGVDAVFDAFVGIPAKAAYGSLTGVNTMTDNPELADTDYSPDALDSLDVALTATGGGTVAKAGFKGASRAARATRAADTSMLGGLARVTRNLASKATGGTVRSADEVATSAKTTVRQSKSTSPENLRPRDEILDSARATSPTQTTNAAEGGWSLNQKLLGGSLAGGAVVGGAGLLGDGATYPDGYAVDKTYTAQPQADRVKQSGKDGQTRGYWVVVDTNGKRVTYLTSSGGTSTTTFPAERGPPFSSPGQADTAYERWRANLRNNAQDPGTYADSPEPTKSPWGGAKTVSTLGSGWHLYRQEHRQQDKTRYFVAGRNSSGTIIYLTAGGAVTTTPTALQSAQEARTAFEGWSEDARNGNARGPDQGADRPGEDEIEQNARNGASSSGGGSLLPLLALGGGAAVLIALVMGVVL